VLAAYRNRLQGAVLALEHRPECKKRNHIRQLEALDYKVTLEPAA
jgi:hypothetical protein